MTDLEILEREQKIKDSLADVFQTGIKEGYEQLVRSALQRNNFNMDLIYRIAIDVSSRKPDESWSRDFIEVGIKDDKNWLDLDIYIRDHKVEFNNCCSGNWTFDDLYYQYVKMMSILAFELNQSLLGYSQAVDRQPLRDADEARWAVDREKQRIRDEEHQREKDAKIQELENAEYIAKYRDLRSWEDGYVEGQEQKVIVNLYKVLKKTPKRFYVEEYRKYEGDVYKPACWYRDEEILKKEDLYNPNWKAVTKQDINIED